MEQLAAARETASERLGLGTVIGVRGSVLDFRFAPDSLPEINEAVEVLWDQPQPLIVEVQSLLDSVTVRGVSLMDTGPRQ